MKQDYINSLIDAYQYLECLEKYDNLIYKYSNNTEEHRKKYYTLKSRHEKTGFKPWLVYILVSPMIFILSAILFAGEMHTFLRIIILTLLIIVLIAPFFVSKWSYISEKNTNERLKNEAVEYWQKIGGPAEKSNNEVIERIKKEKSEIVQKYSFVVDIIPPDYRDTTACGFIASALINKRADNIKEALNLYEETLHRLRLENATHDLINAVASMHNEVLYQMDTINSNIDRTNSRLRDIENLEFYNAFFK